jgi:hypothetical protein
MSAGADVWSQGHGPANSPAADSPNQPGAAHGASKKERQSPALRFARRRLRLIAGWLKTGDEHATIDRLFHSQHVQDLQLIAGLALFVAEAVCSVGLMLVTSNAIYLLLSGSPGQGGAILSTLAAFFKPLATYLAPMIGVLCAVLAWAYQVGSARLGVVDLFACEISSLCRVFFLVDAVRRYRLRFDIDPLADHAGNQLRRPVAQAFSSQENYFPVFETGTKDLQTLEARVVIRITEFYTYMKAVRDSARALADAGTHGGDVGVQAAGSGNEAILDLIYLIFLGLESARLSLDQLVEFEPEHAERVVVVLISELEAYGFLYAHVERADLHKRLFLRSSGYQVAVPELCSRITARANKQDRLWEPAVLLLPTLDERYKDVLKQLSGLKAAAATQ